MSVEIKNLPEAQEEKNVDIFGKRISIELTPENTSFALSSGGLVCMTLTYPGGNKEVFERIVPVRAFPVTEPELFISIREPDTKDVGKGAEIGLIEKLSDFPEEEAALIRKELDKIYHKFDHIKDPFELQIAVVQSVAYIAEK